MQNWSYENEAGVCNTDQDYKYACKAAEIAGVPLTKVVFEKEYWTNVFR